MRMVIVFLDPCHPFGPLAPFPFPNPLHPLVVDQRQTGFVPGRVRHWWQGFCEVQLPPQVLQQVPGNAGGSHLPHPAAAEAAMQMLHRHSADYHCLHNQCLGDYQILLLC